MSETTLHSTLFSQCIFRHSTWKDTDSKQDAQGYPRPGKQECCSYKSTGCGEAASGNEVHCCRKKIETGIDETLTYMDYPAQHWNRIRTTNLIERVNREIKRKIWAIGAFPDGQSALMLVCARLCYVAGTYWEKNRYLNMEHLFEQEKERSFEQESTC